MKVTLIADYFGRGSPQTDVDYTGRWMIRTSGQYSTLYIECFVLEKYQKEVTVYFTRPEIIKRKRFLWWKWEEVYPEIKIPKKIVEDKIRAKVKWVPEECLTLVTETFNQCECYDQPN